MNRRAYIAGRIERNRIALLRLAFIWLTTAFLFNKTPERQLPKRLAAYVNDLISAAEKAFGYLLITSYRINFRGSEYSLDCSTPFDKAEHLFARSNATITLGALTIGGIMMRLKSLQHNLHALHDIARQIAKSVRARQRIAQMRRNSCNGKNGHRHTGHSEARYGLITVLAKTAEYAQTIPP